MKAMSIQSLVLAVATVIFFASCSNTVRIEKAKGTDFSKYKTYSWISPEKPKAAKGNRKNDIAQQNIRYAVDEALQKKGWKEVQSNPDVLVSSELLVEKTQQQERDPVYSESYARSYVNPRTGRYNTFYYPSRFMGYNNYSTTVKEGTITIMLIDADSDKTVWQGSATDKLNYSQMTDKEISKNVKAIFKKF